MKEVRHIVGIVALLLAPGMLRAQAVPGNAGPAASAMPAALQDVGFSPPLNGPMPLELFFDDAARSVGLRGDFCQQPVVVAVVDYYCPLLFYHLAQHGVVGVRL